MTLQKFTDRWGPATLNREVGPTAEYDFEHDLNELLGELADGVRQHLMETIRLKCDEWASPYELGWGHAFAGERYGQTDR